ncbi:MAG: penicillin-binding protein 1C [Cytophagales bacterium]
MKYISTIDRNHRFFSIIIIIALFLAFGFIIVPLPTFENKYSTIVENDNNELLAATIADDSQWRFPPIDSVPRKFEQSIIAFEDKNFKSHFGIDILAIGRAISQNINAGKVKSGGSTITMQLVRLARRGKARNFLEKTIEAIFAIKTDLVWSKSEILKKYASHAPFGGNVVGLSAASWRYFGRDASRLSWAESALLAVLPNHPAMIHLARNRDLLRKKRDRLLFRLYQNNAIDKATYELSIQETLPIEPRPLPQITPHLLQKTISDGKKGQIIKSTINRPLQQKAQEILNRYNTFLRANSIHNGAVLILDVEVGKVLAYVGNTENPKFEHENNVDIITSPRSYGSLLKPILYANMLEDGLLMPNMLIPDIPTNINGYSPQNFSKSYEGSASASKVLSHSLNVPSVRMLQILGTEKFLFTLNKLNLNYLDKSADHYGLSIILGGGEASLWELGSMYGNMARVLDGKEPTQFSYDCKDNLLKYNSKQNFPFSKASLWHTAEAIAEAKRPGANGNWEIFNSSQKIAWKTGTSFGFRDAWSIGFTKKYVVAVWLGNANGEGRAGLTGIGTAAPLMFELFNLLDYSPWFTIPDLEMSMTKICAKSGHKASNLCTETIDRLVSKPCLRTAICPYHLKILLDKNGKYRVNSDCEKLTNMRIENRFVLPPIQEWYYKTKDPTYIPLPPFDVKCKSVTDKFRNMEIIYPRRGSKIFIPRDLSGKKSKIVMEVAHRRAGTIIYWHLDEKYLGETHTFHQMECYAEAGKHKLSIVDINGDMETVSFQVLEK